MQTGRGVLTSRQQQVLECVQDSLERFGYPPTLREIAEQLGINGTLGVIKHLDALERKGYIRKQAGSSRGITLVDHASSVSLPVVGTVPAGALTEAIEDIEGHFSIDRSQVKGDGSFFLRVRGDSMIDASIRDGDLALVHPQATAENGDIVVAMVDGEATLKRFFRERKRIRLQPENPRMLPIIVREGKGNVAIIGKVVGIYRKL